MGCLLRNLARKLGLIRPCGTLEISYPDDDGARPITFGGPSFHITERGVEGPFYPGWWEDRLPRPAPSDGGDTVSLPPDEQITLGGD